MFHHCYYNTIQLKSSEITKQTDDGTNMISCRVCETLHKLYLNTKHKFLFMKIPGYPPA